jgi:hypothetical protein
MWMNRRRFGVFVDTPLPWLFIEIGQRQPAAMAAGEPGFVWVILLVSMRLPRIAIRKSYSRCLSKTQSADRRLPGMLDST